MQDVVPNHNGQTAENRASMPSARMPCTNPAGYEGVTQAGKMVGIRQKSLLSDSENHALSGGNPQGVRVRARREKGRRALQRGTPGGNLL